MRGRTEQPYSCSFGVVLSCHQYLPTSLQYQCNFVARIGEEEQHRQGCTPASGTWPISRILDIIGPLDHHNSNCSLPMRKIPFLAPSFRLLQLCTAASLLLCPRIVARSYYPPPQQQALSRALARVRPPAAHHMSHGSSNLLHSPTAAGAPAPRVPACWPPRAASLLWPPCARAVHLARGLAGWPYAWECGCPLPLPPPPMHR